MRVAFIGHAWHQKTGSSRFLMDLLEQHATVEAFSGQPGNDATKHWAADFHEDRYDVIVIFQLHEAFERLSGRHPNVVFVPMYDAMLWGGAFFWKRAFNTAKIACFSWKLRQEVMRRGAVHAGFQYYPDPAHHVPADDFSSLRGFLWYRRREISPDVAFRLCAGAEFARFTVHDAPDPGNAAPGTWTAPPNIHRFDRTTWSANREPYETALRDSNVFFAPRLFEGIGMSVLEAMASGHCVVAPHAPAMNEYLSHAANGLLYVPGRPTRLDFTHARSLGARARESIERGHARWLTGVPALLDFITTPTAQYVAGGGRLIPVSDRFAPERPGPADRPLVSVVTLCRDAAGVLEATMRSVLAQAGCDFEYVVLDRQSTDGSVDIIRRHAPRLAHWRSEPDNGPGEAMNAALDHVRGDWVLFLNAGDSFASDDALRRMFACVPAGAAVVYGHHVQRLDDGSETLRNAADFATSAARLRSGDLGWDWLAGIPAQPAIAVRRDFLMQSRFDPRTGRAAGLDLLFRAQAAGAVLFHCDEVIAVLAPGGRPDRLDRAAVAKRYGDPGAVDRCFAHADGTDGETASTTLVARLGRLALRVVTILDRHAPALAQSVERLARGSTSQRMVRRLLGRAPATSADPNSL